MQSSLRRVFMLVTVTAVSVFASGCGSHQFVKSVALKSFQKNNDAYAQVDAGIDIGAASLPSIQLPIVDPRNPAVEYGELGFVPGLSGVTDVSIAVNLTEVAKVPGGNATLPNGTVLPVSGLDPSKVIEFPVANTMSKVYIAVDNNLLLVGTAISIRELGSVGQYAGGLNLFESFNISNGVKGIAGVFTSRVPEQNGFGLFVDASSLLPKPGAAPNARGLAVASSALSSSYAWQPFAQRGPNKTMSFSNVDPGRYKRGKISNRMYDLHSNRARLHLN